MNQRTITDQPSILRLLVEQGVDSKIKPADPNRAGAYAMFPDINKYDTWYIADLLNGFYTVTILEGCTTGEAFECLKEYLHRFNRGLVINGRFSVLPVPMPKNN